LLRPLQSLAREPLALRSGWKGLLDPRDEHDRSTPSRSRFDLFADSRISQTAGLDLGGYERGRPKLGAHRFHEIISDGLLQDALWDRLLYLSSISSRLGDFPSACAMEHEPCAGRRCHQVDQSRGRRYRAPPS